MAYSGQAARERSGLGLLGFQPWTTQDLVTMALLVAVGGVFKGYWGGVRLALESALGPILTGWIVGAGFSLFGVLPLLLIPKTGVASVTMVIGSVIELAIGNPFGVEVFVFNFWEGVGPDIVLALFYLANRGNTPAVGWRFAILAGIASTSLGAPYSIVTRGFVSLIRGFSSWGQWALILYVISRVAGGILAGLAAIAIANSLRAMGVLRQGERYTTVKEA